VRGRLHKIQPRARHRHLTTKVPRLARSVKVDFQGEKFDCVYQGSKAQPTVYHITPRGRRKISGPLKAVVLKELMRRNAERDRRQAETEDKAMTTFHASQMEKAVKALKDKAALEIPPTVKVPVQAPEPGWSPALFWSVMAVFAILLLLVIFGIGG
jgi:hypothetical protein